MAQLPWNKTQHLIDITRLFILTAFGRVNFYHSAPLPPEGHETHDTTHTGPGTQSVPTLALEASATFPLAWELPEAVRHIIIPEKWYFVFVKTLLQVSSKMTFVQYRDLW